MEDILFRYQKILDFCAKKKKITRDRKNNIRNFGVISSKVSNIQTYDDDNFIILAIPNPHERE